MESGETFHGNAIKLLGHQHNQKNQKRASNRNNSDTLLEQDHSFLHDADRSIGYIDPKPRTESSTISPSAMRIKGRGEVVIAPSIVPHQGNWIFSQVPDHRANTEAHDEPYVSPYCIEAGYYNRSIRIYHCASNPEYIAHQLTLRDNRLGIDDIRDDARNEAGSFIPREAVFMIIAEDLIYSPFGSAIFFASQNEAGMYDLKFGIYYSYANKTDYCIYSLAQWADTEGLSSHFIYQHETVRPFSEAHWPRFKELHTRLVKAIDAEMEYRKTRAKLRNVARPRAWRRRAPVYSE